MSTAITLSRQVDEWDLYAENAQPETFLVRDLDLANRAGLAKPRAIRSTIQRLIEERQLVDLGALAEGKIVDLSRRHHDGTGNHAGFLVQLVKSGGLGVNDPTFENYYLNAAGAALVLTRLRTPKARELQGEIARVFLAVTAPPPPPTAFALPADVAAVMARLNERLDRLVEGTSRQMELLSTTLLSNAERFDAKLDVHARELAESTTEISTSPVLCKELYALLAELADVLGVPVAKAEGRYRQAYRVLSYRHTPIRDLEARKATVREWIAEARDRAQRELAAPVLPKKTG